LLFLLLYGGFIMKQLKVFLIAFLAFGLCAGVPVSAQGHGRWRNDGFGRGPNPGWGSFSPPEKVKASGTLAIVRGSIAITSNDITYFARGLDRFVGFIDGFKEGAPVDVEGFARPFPQNDKIKLLEIQKMTLDGKEYDLAQGRGDGFTAYCWGPGSCFADGGFNRREMGRGRGGMRGGMMYGW
jgi:hypothetical protein